MDAGLWQESNATSVTLIALKRIVSTRELKLEIEYPAASQQDWAQLVARIVGSADDQTLVSRTRDGIAVAPIFDQRHTGRHLFRPHPRWQVFQRVDHPDPATANAFARADLDGGADGLEIVFPGSAAAHGYGVGVETLDDLDQLLDGIDLERVPLRLDGGYEVRQATAMVAALIERRNLDPARIDIVAESDPANGLFSNGRLVVPYETACAWGADMVQGLLARGLRLRVFVAGGRAVHAAGSSEAQELAYALASAIGHLRMMSDHGIGLDDAAGMVTVSLAADADQFHTIAKLRAMRLLWARFVELIGIPDAPVRLHAETAWRMMTRHDPWTNILRNAIAVTAAGLGGADSVLALPFTQTRGLPDSFARRVARNTQLVLLEEAGLSDVADPAAGSGYVEEMTDALAEAAWGLFQEIEREGGIVASVRAGRFQSRVLEVRRQREVDVATRRDARIGVSEFAWLAERPVEVMQAHPYEVHTSGERLTLPEPGGGKRFGALIAAVHQGASMADMLTTIGYQWERSSAAPWWRTAEPFERLRDLSDRLLAETGRRPELVLATIGTPAEHGTRSAWAADAFAAGGIAVYDTVPAAEAASAFGASGARLACICGGGPIPDDELEALADSLRSAGAAVVYLGVGPDEAKPDRVPAGIDGVLYDGCDILSEIEAAYRRLGFSGVRVT